MPLNIVRDDLVNRREDAIVLPSNEQLVIDGGAGKAVAKAAGMWRLRRACRKAGGCAVGHAVATPAFGFPAKCLVHAVGPVWTGAQGEAALLYQAYASALDCAARFGCESVALPLLSAGTHGCPAHVSLSIALRAAEDFLRDHDMQVVVVLFDKRAVAAGLDFLGEVESRIDDEYVQRYHVEMSPRSAQSVSYSLPGAGYAPPLRDAEALADAGAPAPDAGMPAQSVDAALEELVSPGFTGEFARVPAPAPMASMPTPAPSLEQRLDALDDSFSQSLLQLIDERGLTDAEVYRRANMTRQHFSKIRNNVGYRPTKPTVLALCVALKLDLAATNDLLGRAGFALSHASKFDIIVEYFIERGDFDPFRINETLFYFDQPLLG